MCRTTRWSGPANICLRKAGSAWIVWLIHILFIYSLIDNSLPYWVLFKLQTAYEFFLAFKKQIKTDFWISLDKCLQKVYCALKVLIKQFLERAGPTVTQTILGGKARVYFRRMESNLTLMWSLCVIPHVPPAFLWLPIWKIPVAQKFKHRTSGSYMKF